MYSYFFIFDNMCSCETYKYTIYMYNNILFVIYIYIYTHALCFDTLLVRFVLTGEVLHKKKRIKWNIEFVYFMSVCVCVWGTLSHRFHYTYIKFAIFLDDRCSCWITWSYMEQPYKTYWIKIAEYFFPSEFFCSFVERK